ncbi:hypothetical protein RRG08_060226 [Elysia crispata]|uniref:Uncharacterized protein n=1 Tax=Elysia crispata TaxID=231223 RepID=A0AAE0ZWY9_9GAST|nr:hypothetical protein RRG08_060226 [Elysia crispata]
MRAPVAAVKPYSEQYNQIILYEEDLRHCQFEASVFVYITGARKKKPIKADKIPEKLWCVMMGGGQNSGETVVRHDGEADKIPENLQYVVMGRQTAFQINCPMS